MGFCSVLQNLNISAMNFNCRVTYLQVLACMPLCTYDFSKSSGTRQFDVPCKKFFFCCIGSGLVKKFYIRIRHFHLQFCNHIPMQRQAERIKREKAQAKRGDDLDPHVRDDLIVPVQRFQGSRLASGAVPAPYEQNGFHKDNKEMNNRARKTARVSTSGSSIAAAIVEAENDLEAQVIFPFSIVTIQHSYHLF